MLGSFPSYKATLSGGTLKSRKAMLDTLLRHLDMVRLSAGAAALVLMVGCTGLIGGGTTGGGGGGDDMPLTDAQKAAQSKWLTEAEPVFEANCATCHNGNQAGTPGFLMGTSDLGIRDTLMMFNPQVVDTDAPESSRVLTKGLHNGPALLADQASSILDWITAEKDAAASTTGGSGTIAQTAQFTPVLCTSGSAGDPTCPINHVDLSPIGLPGATVDFVAQALDNNDLYVTNLALNASASTTGAYVTHPLFVSYPSDPTADPIPDSLDRYFAVTMDVKPMAAPVTIDGGNAAFIGFAPTNKISVQFQTAAAYNAADDTSGSGSATGGCKEVQSFVTNAQGPLNTNCASCHAAAGNAAENSMNLTGIKSNFTTDPTDVTTACDQALSQVNKNTPSMSGFFIDPNPGNTTSHPFKFASTATYTTFANAVMTWVTAETTAP